VVTACVENEIDKEDLHYETGVAAFNEVERALDAIFVPLNNALAVEAFADYLENNSLADGSNLLEVWLDAEDLYFPENRVRCGGNTWFVLSGIDTLYSVETNGESLFTTNNTWRYVEHNTGTEQIIKNIGGTDFRYTLSGYPARINQGYYFSQVPVDAALTVGFNEKPIGKTTLECDFNLFGSLKIFNNTYYSYWGGNKDGLREVEITATFPESTPLNHHYFSNTFRIFSSGTYTINIEDVTMDKTDQVNVSIVSPSSRTREVTVTYKGDTVVF
jgi:hypothetical protein